MIRYIVGSQKPYSRFLNITIEISNLSESVLDLRLPIWRPGKYARQNFAEKVRGFKVTNTDGNTLNWTKSGSHIWQINTHKSDLIKVEYEYYSDTMDAGNGCSVDSNKLYINPGTCLMYVKERIEGAAQIMLYTTKDLTVATTLEELDETEFTTQTIKSTEYKKYTKYYYKASNYHQIVDTPILASNNMLHLDSEIEGVKFNFWFEGNINLPQERFLQDMTKIITTSMDLFGNFPQSRYDFIYPVVDKPMMHGVEHTKSTVIVMGPGEQIYSHIEDETKMSLIHRYFLTTTVHELFHAWNVKKFLPQEYIDLQYEEEILSSMHWMSEGLTNYYENKLSRLSGLFKEEEILKIQAEEIQNYLHNMDIIPMSVSMSSLESWVDGYDRDKTPFRTPNFYTKGGLIFWILDLMIEHRTNKQKSLDDFVRYLDQNFDTTKGYSENDIIEALNISTGLDLGGEVKNLVHSCESIIPQLKGQLSLDKIELKLEQNLDKSQSLLGLKHKNNEVVAVYPESPSHKAEIFIKDKLVAINGVTIEGQSSLNDLINNAMRQEKFTITVLRSNSLIEKNIKVKDINPENQYFKLVKLEKSEDI